MNGFKESAIQSVGWSVGWSVDWSANQLRDKNIIKYLQKVCSKTAVLIYFELYHTYRDSGPPIYDSRKAVEVSVKQSSVSSSGTPLLDNRLTILRNEMIQLPLWNKTWNE